jgi:MFS superfamily sulfate permease-like transporter
MTPEASTPEQQPSPSTTKLLTAQNLAADIPAGTVTFLVALPLCLGIALASGAPLFSGLLAGIVGGLVVGSISGSSTSVSGPAAGLTAIVAAQIEALGSFEAFLFATFLAGAMQLLLGIARAGFIAAFFPSAVVKGLLAAIGLLLILKQLPHLFGHDPSPVGELAFSQLDHRNTFSELVDTLTDIEPSAALIGLISIVILAGWNRVPLLRRSPVPAPLLVAGLAIGLNLLLQGFGERWALGAGHLVQVPVLESLSQAPSLLRLPDFSGWQEPGLYVAAVTSAIVASLETLLNLDAVDNLDPKQRRSPPSRELVAQGAGNMLAGLVGGLPMTSVIIRSSVNVQSGNATKLSAIFHGVLLLACVLLLPGLLNLIPLSALAAILIVTGFKLASPKLIKRMWNEGWSQFLPFAFTVCAILATDLLKGIVAGLLVSIGFILRSSVRHPIKRIKEHHATGDILRITLKEQLSFLDRAALENLTNQLEPGSHVLFDARDSTYIGPDILHLIHEFADTKAPARNIKVSLLGLKRHYSHLPDKVLYVDYSSREVQEQLSPAKVLELLKQGNDRFRSGQRIARDLMGQVESTAGGQAPMAVVLSCIDSRAPAELLFDLGIGDVFSIRIAGNVAKEKVLGSMEYGCAVAGAKLIVVMGHTSCGAVTAAVDSYQAPQTVGEMTGCKHIDVLVNEIQASIEPRKPIPNPDSSERAVYIDDVARRHVQRTIDLIQRKSPALSHLIREGKVGIVGAVYDVRSGKVDFWHTTDLQRSRSDSGHQLGDALPTAPAEQAS